VVISGGEPTLRKDLISLCTKIKQMGYPVKLDTNGSRPDVIRSLIKGGLVDYIAMDIKTDPFSYEPFIAKTCNPGRILMSIRTIMESELAYEFRTTCVKPIVNEYVISKITRIIKSAPLYALQRFQAARVLDPGFFKSRGSGCDEGELEKLRALADPWVKECIVR